MAAAEEETRRTPGLLAAQYLSQLRFRREGALSPARALATRVPE
jgi:hypothetical protein